MPSRGIKLRADECHLKKEVRYLGRLVSADGYRPDPADVAVLDKIRSPPMNIGELQSLVLSVLCARFFTKDQAIVRYVERSRKEGEQER